MTQESDRIQHRNLNKKLDLARILNNLTFGGISITNKKKGGEVVISDNPTIGSLIVDPNGESKLDDEIESSEFLLDVDTSHGHYKGKKRRPRTSDTDLQRKLGIS